MNEKLLRKAKNFRNKGNTYDEIAKKLRIPKTTIYDNLQACQTGDFTRKSPGRPRYFTDEFENELARVLRASVENGQRVTLPVIAKIAKELCRNEMEKTKVTLDWCQSFIERRSESFQLSMKTASPAATKDKTGPYKEDKVTFMDTMRSLSPHMVEAINVGRFGNTDELQVIIY